MTREEREKLVYKLASEDLERVDILILREFFHRKRMEYYFEYEDDELLDMVKFLEEDK